MTYIPGNASQAYSYNLYFQGSSLSPSRAIRTLGTIAVDATDLSNGTNLGGSVSWNGFGYLHYFVLPSSGTPNERVYLYNIY